MRLSVEHTTGFHYASPVASSYNEARMVPVQSEYQTVWGSRVRIDPNPWSFTYVDYWGTRVTAFELHQPHETLTVTSFGLVETTGDDEPWDTEEVPNSDLGWSALADPTVTSSMAEFLVLSPRTAPTDELKALAQDAAVDASPRAAALRICQLIAERVAYEKGSTSVSTTAAQAWEGGKGVCQDFSHLAVGALRTIGLPARYVSGYLYPGTETTDLNTAIGGESHSWVEWWCGSWVQWDPTMSARITDSYVRVGHGRDYNDVAPLRGTYAGGTSEMFVTVAMTRLG